MFDVSIIEPSDVDISVSVTLFRMDDGTAHGTNLNTACGENAILWCYEWCKI